MESGFIIYSAVLNERFVFTISVQKIMMGLISFLIGNPFGVDIAADHKARISHAIARTNWKRLKIFLLIGFCVESLLIIFIDIPGLSNKTPEDLWLPRSYLALHALIGIIALAGAILSSRLLKKSDPLSQDLLTPVVCSLLLIPISIITGLDQMTTRQITVFLVNLLVGSTFFIIKPPLNYLVYTIPYIFFVAGLFIFQNDQTIRASHLVNGSVFFLAVLIISRFVYHNHVSHLSKNIKLEEANQKLSFLSSHDPLTGLSNRRYFEMQMKRKLSIINHYHHTSCLILMDLDHFKQINDRYGHFVGDKVLQSAASVIENNIRDVDLAARWGGEEFLLLISPTTSEGAFQAADRIRKALNEHVLTIENQEIRITASFGVTTINFRDFKEDPFLTAFQQTDKALYQAKQKGRNQVVVSSEFAEFSLL